MYLPSSFNETDSGRILEIVARHPLATLISPDQPQALVSHVPLLLKTENGENLEGSRLLGHLARANPHAKRLAQVPCLAIFHGPNAYVSPNCYASPGVPTWNYVVVHLTGSVRLMESQSETLDVLATMTTHFEAGETEPWHLSDDENSQSLTSAILAFEIRIESVSAKFKLSQNRPPADREQVRSALAIRNPKLAQLMA